MKIRVLLTALLIVCVPLTGQAAKKKKPLAVEVSSSSDGLPLVTLTASGTPLSEVAERLAGKLKTRIDVSAAARSYRVTTALDRQPLDLTLRELAPQAWVDGILTGGASRKEQDLSIYLRMAGEAAPSLDEMKKSTSETVMFFGNTEDGGADPFVGKLEVTYRNDRLRVSAKHQPLSVVVAKLADTLGIPFQLSGDSSEVVDVSVSDATLEQVMSALTPSVKLYHRKDLATFRTTPIRLVLEEAFEPAKPNP